LFIARSIPDVENLFQPLEECIRNIFIPAVTGHSPSGDIERACWLFQHKLVVWVYQPNQNVFV